MASNTLTVRLPPDTEAELRKAAKRKDRPLSYIVRIAVEDYLRRHAASERV